MKMNTMYWGVQIIAESDNDEACLRHLVKSLPIENVSAYEYGGVTEIGEGDGNTDPCSLSLDEEDLKAARYAIQIHR